MMILPIFDLNSRGVLSLCAKLANSHEYISDKLVLPMSQTTHALHDFRSRYVKMLHTNHVKVKVVVNVSEPNIVIFLPYLLPRTFAFVDALM